MKTAMQELIEWMGKNDYYGKGFFYAAYSLIEKEKKQIMEAYIDGHYIKDEFYNPKDYYNETYNQNK
jgi:hypothetical protein